MQKKVLFHFLFIIVLLINSCSDSNSNKKDETLISETPSSSQIDLNSENRYAYITEVFEANNNIFVKVDYVDYLTGKEAIEAEWRDKAYHIDGSDTISMISDGYYISNINTKVRTFKINKNAKIKNIIDDDGPHKLNPPKNINLEQLNTYKNMKTLLLFHVEEGIIKSIDERFLP